MNIILMQGFRVMNIMNCTDNCFGNSKANDYERFARALQIKTFTKEIAALYDNALTFKEFFTSMTSKYDKQQVCLMLEPWVSLFVRDLILERKFLIENQWVVYAPAKLNLDVVTVTASEYQVGGSKRLRSFFPEIPSYLV